ncbi:IclR family transcriptional regulator [Arthrobacter crystallopoietes BAB-32]|uniref:Glycerol operon regulatory protein n=1 Tax=Arthrobacter crystallopoietes BAB-32 TaxID=1246476 RepID=N1V0L9_9MICC|nr:IclR family transcriptional regulator [Arthrobacter crystallopoietes]EMY36201.1 IclR family transcriptional regulator [Arthrobacter crystallopoietes BAB-32]
MSVLEEFDDESPESLHRGVQSVDRAITVLKILARRGATGVSDIAEEMGVHKSTASRLLASLDQGGLVQQNSERGKYQLGLEILRLANAIPGRLSLVHEARPVLEALADKYKETVNLAVLRSNYAVNVDQAMGPSSLATHDWIGSLTPLHATSSGKVLLAGLTSEQRLQILKQTRMPAQTAKTITSRQKLEQQLLEIAAAGYATVYEEFEIGLNAIAAPVHDHIGAVIGSVSISGPSFRFKPEEVPGLVEDLKQAGHDISARMGYAVE